jgi:hypothetical protein
MLSRSLAVLAISAPLPRQPRAGQLPHDLIVLNHVKFQLGNKSAEPNCALFQPKRLAF